MRCSLTELMKSIVVLHPLGKEGNIENRITFYHFGFSDEQDQAKKYYEEYNIYKQLSNKDDDETCIEGCE